MNFLKENKRFSFKLGGVSAWDLEHKCESVESGCEITTTYVFEGGVKVVNVAKKYEKFDAFEWVNYIENTSDKPSEIISELWDCDITLPYEHEAPKQKVSYIPNIKTATKIYAPTGSTWSKEEFYTNVDTIHGGSRRINHIYPGMTRCYSASGGRSSENSAPFFNVHKNGKGYIFAVGWTGQWNASISRTEDDVVFRSKIEDTFFKLLPGEKIRTSSIVLMAYEGDVVSSHNKWRRLIKEHFSLIGQEGRGEVAPLSAMIWGGMKSESVLERVENIKKNNIPVEYIWMDAGWYGEGTLPSPDEFEGNWGDKIGDFRVSTLVHPNELRDVADAVHDAGMKFLLWLEPERAAKTVPVATEHPEWVLSNGNENEPNRIVNLGCDEAWEHCFNMLSHFIDDLKLDCYRQDFNFPPLGCWRKNDAEDRRGITEIKHITGLYRLWDALLERFPNLIIDNCASGGRRIDIETLRRSVPLWRSDYQCSADYDVEASQCHQQNYNTWMPYSGTGAGRVCDEYRIRSAYAAATGISYFYSEKENFYLEKTDFIKKYTEEYLTLRPYYSCDFYPLTEYSDRLDTWFAVQFDRPEENDGIVQVFRRENSPYETASFSLGGIKENSTYIFKDIDGGKFEVSGKELAEKGLSLDVPCKRCAKIYTYKII